MRLFGWTRLPFVFAIALGTVVLATLAAPASARPASAARIMASGEHDLVIVPPAELNLTAPPYVVPGVLTVTYGEQVTLLQVIDDVPPADVVQPQGGKVPPPTSGRYVAVKVKVTNTGSQPDALADFQLQGSGGYLPMSTDDTVRGCDYYFPFPPVTLDAGSTYTSCDVYYVKDGVTIVSATAGIGFADASANGKWRIVQHPPARRSYVALGDSYSSGEGAGDYAAAAADCHRSAHAWPRLAARALPGLLAMPSGGLIACSGADSAAIGAELGTLDALRARPALITLTMGGNDVGFNDVLRDCVLPWKNCKAAIGTAQGKIDHEDPILIRDYKKIREFEPQATLIVVGYPQLFPSSWDDVVQPYCLWLTDPKLIALNKLDASLDRVIQRAAKAAGVSFVPIPGALAGHEACTAHSWIYPIPIPDPFKNWNQQDGHPTVPGQEKIAELVESYLTGRYYV